MQRIFAQRLHKDFLFRILIWVTYFILFCRLGVGIVFNPEARNEAFADIGNGVNTAAAEMEIQKYF